jgi:beta-alanine--pyruvate transaminase
MSNRLKVTPNDLSAFWMPFTANRQFKANPRLFSRAEGLYYWTPDGRQVLDAASGLWCVNAGHGRKEITEAVSKQIAVMDYAPPFQMGHPIAFEFANALVEITPKGLDRVFFTNSGSESVDTALKIAIAYHRVRGEGARTRLIGRERGYHGVGFGGISVGGMVNNRKAYGVLLPGTDSHLPAPYDRAKHAFTKGEPAGGAEYADELERICALHDPSTIAAVIVEPMAGSGGVVASPKEYLPRLRAICDKYGILLILDEVITGFGRLGHAFASERYGVVPDMITFAKGVTNAAVPMGGVIAKTAIYDAFRDDKEWMIELFHGYTYSGHPLAAAAGLASLDLYRDEDIFGHAAKMETMFAEAVMSLRSSPNVIDIRVVGLAAAIDLSAHKDGVGKRGFEAMVRAFEEEALVIRGSGDSVVLSPALIATEDDLTRIVEGVRAVLARVG